MVFGQLAMPVPCRAEAPPPPCFSTAPHRCDQPAKYHPVLWRRLKRVIALAGFIEKGDLIWRRLRRATALRRAAALADYWTTKENKQKSKHTFVRPMKNVKNVPKRVRSLLFPYY